MKTRFALGVMTLGMVGLLAAQQPVAKPNDNGLPEGPLLIKLPANTRCSISVTNLETQPGASNQTGKKVVQRVVLIQSGNLGVKEVTDVASGVKTETWQAGEYNVTLGGVDDFPVVTKAGNTGPDLRGAAGNDAAAYRAAPDYPGMECVSKKNFVGVVTANGRPCLAFKDSDTESAAYVDLKTRLPISARTVDMGYTYSFSEAPVGSVVLPAKAIDAISESKLRYQRAAARSAP